MVHSLLSMRIPDMTNATKTLKLYQGVVANAAEVIVPAIVGARAVAVSTSYETPLAYDVRVDAVHEASVTVSYWLSGTDVGREVFSTEVQPRVWRTLDSSGIGAVIDDLVAGRGNKVAHDNLLQVAELMARNVRNPAPVPQPAALAAPGAPVVRLNPRSTEWQGRR